VYGRGCCKCLFLLGRGPWRGKPGGGKDVLAGYWGLVIGRGAIYVQAGGLWKRIGFVPLVILLRGSHVTLFSHLLEHIPEFIAPKFQDN
jgi:hypothetical protein